MSSDENAARSGDSPEPQQELLAPGAPASPTPGAPLVLLPPEPSPTVPIPPPVLPTGGVPLPPPGFPGYPSSLPHVPLPFVAAPPLDPPAPAPADLQELQTTIEDLRMELQTLKVAGQSQWGSQRRDLPDCPLTLPPFRVSPTNEAIATRAALCQYHDAITRSWYANSRGTLEVLYEIERAPGVPGALLTGLAQYTRAAGQVPYKRKDPGLWSHFLELYNRCIYIDEWAHLQSLNQTMQTPRQAGQPVAVYIAQVQAALRMYQQQDYPHPPDEAFLVTSILPLLRFDHSPLSGIKLQMATWLKNASKTEITLETLAGYLQSYPEIQAHIASERKGGSVGRRYLHAEEEGGEGGQSLPPPPMALSENGNKGSGWLPDLTTDVTPGLAVEQLLRSYNVSEHTSSVNLGLNKFPKRIAKHLHPGAKMAAMRHDIKHRLGVECGRCFRKSCAGAPPVVSRDIRHPSVKSVLNTPCANKADAGYLPDDICWVLFNILKFLNVGGPAEEAKRHYATFVRLFYDTAGKPDNDVYVDHVKTIVKNAIAADGKGNSPSFCSRLPIALLSTPSTVEIPLPLCPHTPHVEIPLPPCPDTPPTASSSHQPLFSPPAQSVDTLHSFLSWTGPMANLPDLGNPFKLAGTQWWTEYRQLLATVGLAKYVRQASSSELGSFGDGPASTPQCVVLQIPFWYSGPKGSVLVLDNVRIVQNSVGLLDGKHNLAALGFECKLRSTDGATSFKVKGKPLDFYDGGQHYFLKLGEPKPIDKGTSALSIQRDVGGKYWAVKVACATEHMAHGSFGSEPQLTLEPSKNRVLCTDTTPEAKLEPSTSAPSRNQCSVTTPVPTPWPWLLSHTFPSYVRHVPQKPLTSADFARLHKAWGHAPVSVMIPYLKRGDYDETAIAALAQHFDCPMCPGQALAAPQRPRSAIHAETGPGQAGHVDVGHFQSAGLSFAVMVVADSFSNHLFGDVVQENGAAMAQAYVNRVPEQYTTLTYDLAGWARGEAFVDFMTQIGVAVQYLPADSHWGSGAETGMYLLRTGLAAVFADFPTLDPTHAVQLALTRINSRPLRLSSGTTSMSRRAIHYGRDLPLTDVAVLLTSLPTPPLSPELLHLHNLRNISNEVHSQHDANRVRSRVGRALRSRAASLPIVRPGDYYLYWHKGLSKRERGWRGPVLHVGMVGTNCLGYYRGALVSTHRSRIYPLDTPRRKPHAPTEVNVPPWVLEGRLAENMHQTSPMDDADRADAVDSGAQSGPAPFLFPGPDTGAPLGLPPLPLPSGPGVPGGPPSVPAPVVGMPLADGLVTGSGLDLPPLPDLPDMPLPALQLLAGPAVSAPLPASADAAGVAEDNAPLAEENVTAPLPASADAAGVADDNAPFDNAPFAEENALNEADGPNHEALQQEMGQDVPPPLEDTESDSDTDSWAEAEEAEPSRRKRALSFEGDTDAEHRKRARAYARAARRAPSEAVDADGHRQRARADDRNKKPRHVTWAAELTTVLGRETTFQLPRSWTRTKDAVFAYEPSRAGLKPIQVMLTNKKRKRTVVMEYKEAAHIPEMKAAMEAEIDSFKRMGCVEAVQLTSLSARANCVSTKWVLATKTTEKGQKRYKARLVARGFEDKMKEQVTRDAPVASTASQRMVIQACVESQYRVHSYDFTCAFLQGKSIQRDVYIMPPAGYGIPAGTVWKLKRPVYGLTSAPKAWYDRLLEAMQKAGLDANVTDEGVLRLLTKTGQICGILALHVDDTIGGGTAAFHKVMKSVNDALEIGAHEMDNFHYKGLRVTTVWKDNVFEIQLDGDEYLDATETMHIPEGDDDQLLSFTERTDFRSVAGCIGYCAQAFRPELALECSLLGRHFQAPTIRNAKIANQILTWTKENRYPLCFRKGACEAITVFCDSSGPSENGTQGGRVACVTDSRGHHIGGFLHWESKKVSRVCKATLTGETLSAGEGHELGMWLQQMWSEMTGQKLALRLVVDSEGLSHNVTTTKLPLQKRLRIDMACLRQGLRRGEFTMTWVPSAANISDPLTKTSQHSSHELLPPNAKLKRGLLLALKTNCAHMDGVPQVTKSQADVCNY